jgi:tungstate transport system substrate-binding protein
MAERPLTLFAAVFVTVFTLLLGSCGGGSDKELILGATTSVQDTGLLDEIIRAFEEITDYDVTPVVGGSGQTLETARRGEFDVVLTHSPDDEDTFIADGQGLDRRPVMYNSFLIAGPENDPAGVAGATSMGEAFQRIASGEHMFISRGDNSGTHRREQAIWENLGIDPDGQSWYQVSSTGQGQNLLVAADKRAYTLTDSSTLKVFAKRSGLAALVTDREQPNFYSVIRVSPEKHSNVNAAAGIAFAEFITSVAGQCLIAEFGVEEYGESLFEAAIGCRASNAGG